MTVERRPNSMKAPPADRRSVANPDPVKVQIREPYLRPILTTTKAFYASVVFALLVLVLGLYAFYLQFTVGHVVTGMGIISTGGATYGIYIVFAIYFIGISYAGISTSAAVRLLGLEKYRPITRIAELLTVIALILGATSILVDLGDPLDAVIYLPLYGRLTSPFFYTFSVVMAGYLWASLVYIFLSGRRDAAIVKEKATRFKWLYRLWSWRYEFNSSMEQRHEKALWWLSLAVLPMLVMAHSFLGYVFGLQGGRPGWYSAIQAPAFVVIAGASGISALMIIAAIVRRVFGYREQLSLDIFRGLSNFVGVSVAAYLYFMASEAYTGLYAAPAQEQAVYQAIYFGTYAPVAWFAVGSFIAAFLMIFAMFLRKKYNLTWIITAAVLVNLAAIAVRYLIVVPSQTHGMLLPYPVGSYSPNWVEWSLVAGLFALGFLLYTAFVKIFPIVELPHESMEGAAR
jgi:molybdopterin-containing oxidoreductase family membrane subunit